MARKVRSPGSIFIRSGYSARLYVKFKGQLIATGLTDSKENRKFCESILWILWRRSMGMCDVEGFTNSELLDQPQLPQIGLHAVDEARAKFDAWMVATRKATKTIAAYREAIMLVDPQDMTGDEFERAAMRYVTKSGVSPASVNIRMRNFRVFARWCVKHRLLDREPNVMEYAPKAVRKPVVVLTHDEWMSVLNAIRARRKHAGAYTFVRFLEFLMATGLRVTEAMTVKRRQVSTFDGVPLLKMSNKVDGDEEYIPLSTKATDILHERLKTTKHDTDQLWPWRASSYSSLLRMFNEALESAGIDTDRRSGFHIIRKTFRHRLKQAGVSLGDAKSLLRHRSINVTEQYYTYYAALDLKKALDMAESWKEDPPQSPLTLVS